MGLGRSLNKFQDVVRAILAQKKLDSHKWSRQELMKYQQQQLSTLVRHAILFSPFYRELYRHVKTENGFNLNDLPVTNKATMMDNFDAFVTDPRLKLQELQAHIGGIARDDAFHLDEYRVHTTSGSSGLKGVFVSNREEWRTASAVYFRCGAIMGVKPKVPRCKMAVVFAGSALHVSYRMSTSNDVGVINVRRLEATTRVQDLVDALNEFQPECLSGYPSVISLLALEQLEGRLDIHPRVIGTAGELLTGDMSQKIGEAWGVVPYNYYGLTEAGAFLGADCSFHQGIHVFEDFFIVEVVDDKNKPVPDGITGDKFLLTNLFNFTQPLIRYEISDMISVASEPCSCGRAFKRITVMDGRNDDFVRLPGRRGTDVRVHPLNFRSPLASFSEIREYQIVQEPDGIDVFLVLKQGISGDQVAERVKNKLREKIDSLGAVCPDIRLRPVPQLERDHRKMGKLRLVKSNINKGGLPR
jgi:putative adenylate-forming enzyme